MKITIKPAKIGIHIDTEKIYPELENIEITPSETEQNFKSSKYGYGNVKVKAINSEKLDITPTFENQNFSGLYDEVNVERIVADELKVTPSTETQVFTGLYNKIEVEAGQFGTDTTDATATEAEILEGTTAYITSGKVEGTMPNNGDINIIPEVTNQVIRPAGYYSSIQVEKIENTDFYKDCKSMVMQLLYPEKLLPDTFEQLKYVESTGEQYIKLSDWYDTKLSTSNFYDIVADVQFTVLPSEYDDKWHLNGVGAITGTTTLNKYDTLLYFGYSYYNPSLSDPIPKFCYSPSLKNTDCVTDRYIDTERHTFKVISNANKAEAGFWIDDEHVDTRGSTLSTKKFGYPFYIFGYENNSGVIGNKQKVYRFQLLNDDGSLFYDLIPARRKSDNAIGLYDTVKGMFYSNNGTGEFLYGTLEDALLKDDLEELLNLQLKNNA